MAARCERRSPRPLRVRDGPAGGPAAPATALAVRQFTVTAVTQRDLALFLGASAQARRHRELSAKALTPLHAEDQARQL